MQISREAAVVPPQKVMDLLAMDDDLTSDEVEIDAALVKKWCTAACLARGTKVVLFENNVVTVSLMAEYRQFQGRIAVFIKNNCSSSSEIHSLDVNVAVAAVDGNALNVKQQPPSATRIAFNDEVRSLIAVDCSLPFSSFPNLEVSFGINNSKYR